MTNMYRESKEKKASKKKQVSKKKHDMEAFQDEEGSYLRREPVRKEQTLEKEAKQHDSVEVLARQIYQEKGGNDLDNWLEAERILKNAPSAEYKRNVLLY